MLTVKDLMVGLTCFSDLGFGFINDGSFDLDEHRPGLHLYIVEVNVYLHS